MSNITHPLKIKLRLGNLKVFSNEQLKRLINLESSMESGVKIDVKIDQKYQNCIEEKENCNNSYSIEKLIELKDYASTIIEQIPNNYNEVKKVLFIHKYLINSLDFSLSIDDGIPLSRSISRAFRLLMEELGIECKTIYSDTNYWNVVKLNGAWYHIDVYDAFLKYDRMTRKKNECYLKNEKSILKDGKHCSRIVYYSDKDELSKNSILKVKVPKKQ